MAKLIKCACGYVARGDTDDEVVGEIEAHMQEDHPDLFGKVTREQILDWIEET
jgi:predicted small metal-binding protein